MSLGRFSPVRHSSARIVRIFHGRYFGRFAACSEQLRHVIRRCLELVELYAVLLGKPGNSIGDAHLPVPDAIVDGVDGLAYRNVDDAIVGVAGDIAAAVAESGVAGRS